MFKIMGIHTGKIYYSGDTSTTCDLGIHFKHLSMKEVVASNGFLLTFTANDKDISVAMKLSEIIELKNALNMAFS